MTTAPLDAPPRVGAGTGTTVGGPGSAVSIYGVVAVTAVLLALVGFSPSANSLFWSPKAAILPVLAAVGVVPLISMMLRRERSAIFAGAFLAVASASTFASPNRTVAVFGQYYQGTGLLFVAAVVGAWAIGRHLTHRDVRLVAAALLASFGANVVVAVAESVVDLSEFHLFLFEGRTTALMGNPIHAGALGAGVAAFAVHRTLERSPRWLAALVPAGLLIQTSGTRVAVAVAVAALAFAVPQRAWLRLGLATFALAGGFLLAVAIPQPHGAAGATDRVTHGMSSGLTARTLHWSIAATAISERPLLGFGPGNFATATSRYRTAEIVLAEGPDRIFFDAHNIFVEYATTTGGVGLVAFAAWVICGVRQARGAFLWFSAAVLAVHLLQPQFAGTTPLAFLALGAASPAPVGHRVRWVVPLLAVAGLSFGGLLLAGDTMLRTSELDFTIADAQRANTILPRWTVTANQLAKLYSFEAIRTRTPEPLAEAARWRREATARDPSDAFAWNLLGAFELARERPRPAQTAFRAALEADPWSERALTGLVEAELRLGAKNEAALHLEKLERIATTPAQTARIDRFRRRLAT